MRQKAIGLFQAKALLRAFPPTRRYLIGVSGGRDSVALLQSLVDLGYDKLVVCHFNHQLRGRSSDADARFVQGLVTKYQRQIVGQANCLPNSRHGKRACPTIAFELGSTSVAALAKKKKISIETAAREARYAFFAKMARQKKCRAIFLAHHADDLVETFLINLFRGAGTAGLASMREVSTRRINSVSLTIVRPLLGTWRTDVDKYVRAHGLKYREDASNKDLVPLRNRFRNRIIPYLEKSAGRNIRQSIWRAATIAADEEAFVDGLSRDGKHSTVLSVEDLRGLPTALQRRSILNWLRGHEVSDVSFDVIERVRSLLDGTSKIAKINLPQDRHVRRRQKRIFIEN